MIDRFKMMLSIIPFGTWYPKIKGDVRKKANEKKKNVGRELTTVHSTNNGCSAAVIRPCLARSLGQCHPKPPSSQSTRQRGPAPST